MAEVLDVIDKNGNVIGRATREECHEKGLLHKTASIFVFKDDSKKEILLMRRSSKSDQDAGRYCHIGGHVPSGQSYEEAARRELNEEIFYGHIMSKEIKFEAVSQHMYNDLPNNFEMTKLFYAIHPGPFFPDPFESSGELKFFDMDGLLAEIKNNPEKFTNAFRLNLEEYFRVMGR